jgi:XRE family aerobic/anaerobic benzoate catabolism transcriptional regulator
LTLQNIFEVHGEEYYRSLEHHSLVTLLANRPSAVVAVAGGLVAREDTYELLRRHSVTFWLKADPQDHWDRVLQQDPRPMANDPNAMAQLQTILKRREPLYALANHTIDTSELGLTQSVREIVARYREQN